MGHIKDSLVIKHLDQKIHTLEAIIVKMGHMCVGTTGVGKDEEVNSTCIVIDC